MDDIVNMIEKSLKEEKDYLKSLSKLTNLDHKPPNIPLITYILSDNLKHISENNSIVRRKIKGKKVNQNNKTSVYF